MTSSNGNIFRVTGPLWGNPPVNDGFPSQRPVVRSFDVFFDLHLNKRLRTQSRHRWFETASGSLWRHCNDWSHMTVSVNYHLMWGNHYRSGISLCMLIVTYSVSTECRSYCLMCSDNGSPHQQQAMASNTTSKSATCPWLAVISGLWSG